MDRRLVLALAASVALALGACSGSVAGNTTLSEGPHPNWNSPLPNALSYPGGVPVPAAVRKSLIFPITTPEFGIPPKLIRVTDPARATGAGRSIAFLYDFTGRNGFAGDGRLVVYESTPRTTEALLLAVAGNPPGSSADSNVVHLGTHSALFIHYGGIGRVMWITSGVLFDITGPAAPQAAVLRLARLLAAQA